MTNITTEQVQHLAQLSSLRLEAQELEDLTNDIDNILGYVEQLSELDTDNVQPTYQVNSLQNVSRSDDIIDYPVTREQLINLAPGGTSDNQVKVPKVL